MTAQLKLSFEHEPPPELDAGAQVVIDGGKSSNKLEFMHELSRQLSFPSYFGNNWDAYDESMTEVLDDLGERALSIAVRNGRTLWRNLPYDAGKFLQCTLEAFQRAGRAGEVVFYEM